MMGFLGQMQSMLLYNPHASAEPTLLRDVSTCEEKTRRCVVASDPNLRTLDSQRVWYGAGASDSAGWLRVACPVSSCLLVARYCPDPFFRLHSGRNQNC